MAKKCDICGEVHEVWQAHVFRDFQKADDSGGADRAPRKEDRKRPKRDVGGSGADGAVSVRLPCPCGCGVEVEIEVKPKFATPACRQRAKRKRDAAK